MLALGVFRSNEIQTYINNIEATRTTTDVVLQVKHSCFCSVSKLERFFWT